MAQWQLRILAAVELLVVQYGPNLPIRKKEYIMRNWIIKNKLIVIGALVGATAGFLYWKYIGCLTGTCAITSNPIRSTLYFAVLGGLLFSIFRKDQKQKTFTPPNQGDLPG